MAPAVFPIRVCYDEGAPTFFSDLPHLKPDLDKKCKVRPDGPRVGFPVALGSFPATVVEEPHQSENVCLGRQKVLPTS